MAEAESHRWLGEAEGLKVSLAGARAKLDEMDQITRTLIAAGQMPGRGPRPVAG
jgi:hypothetical protein